ncbi:hypothetical protein TRVA0_012S02344 [Trichomonascus vanleenenianus]|uniref:uncharacterized protein n=1 Tax=Trichomonascus vanleenenianus TaxID=2268995 RepID=UPI003ECA686A
MRFPYGRYLIRCHYDITEQEKQKVLALLYQRGGQVEGYVTAYDIQVIANKEIAAVVNKFPGVKCMASC